MDSADHEVTCFLCGIGSDGEHSMLWQAVKDDDTPVTYYHPSCMAFPLGQLLGLQQDSVLDYMSSDKMSLAEVTKMLQPIAGAQQQCCVCKQSGPILLRCAHPGCGLRYHYPCARRSALEGSAIFSPPTLQVACRAHARCSLPAWGVERAWMGMWLEGQGGWSGGASGGQAASCWGDAFGASVRTAAERWAPHLLLQRPDHAQQLPHHQQTGERAAGAAAAEALALLRAAAADASPNGLALRPCAEGLLLGRREACIRPIPRPMQTQAASAEAATLGPHAGGTAANTAAAAAETTGVGPGAAAAADAGAGTTGAEAGGAAAAAAPTTSSPAPAPAPAREALLCTSNLKDSNLKAPCSILVPRHTASQLHPDLASAPLGAASPWRPVSISAAAGGAPYALALERRHDSRQARPFSYRVRDLSVRTGGSVGNLWRLLEAVGAGRGSRDVALVVRADGSLVLRLATQQEVDACREEEERGRLPRRRLGSLASQASSAGAAGWAAEAVAEGAEGAAAAGAGYWLREQAQEGTGGDAAAAAAVVAAACNANGGGDGEPQAEALELAPPFKRQRINAAVGSSGPGAATMVANAGSSGAGAAEACIPLRGARSLPGACVSVVFVPKAEVGPLLRAAGVPAGGLAVNSKAQLQMRACAAAAAGPFPTLLDHRRQGTWTVYTLQGMGPVLRALGAQAGDVLLLRPAAGDHCMEARIERAGSGPVAAPRTLQVTGAAGQEGLPSRRRSKAEGRRAREALRRAMLAMPVPEEDDALAGTAHGGPRVRVRLGQEAFSCNRVTLPAEQERGLAGLMAGDRASADGGADGGSSAAALLPYGSEVQVSGHGVCVVARWKRVFGKSACIEGLWPLLQAAGAEHGDVLVLRQAEGAASSSSSLSCALSAEVVAVRDSGRRQRQQQQLQPQQQQEEVPQVQQQQQQALQQQRQQVVSPFQQRSAVAVTNALPATDQLPQAAAAQLPAVRSNEGMRLRGTALVRAALRHAHGGGVPVCGKRKAPATATAGAGAAAAHKAPRLVHRQPPMAKSLQHQAAAAAAPPSAPAGPGELLLGLPAVRVRVKIEPGLSDDDAAVEGPLDAPFAWAAPDGFEPAASPQQQQRLLGSGGSSRSGGTSGGGGWRLVHGDSGGLLQHAAPAPRPLPPSAAHAAAPTPSPPHPLPQPHNQPSPLPAAAASPGCTPAPPATPAPGVWVWRKALSASEVRSRTLHVTAECMAGLMGHLVPHESCFNGALPLVLVAGPPGHERQFQLVLRWSRPDAAGGGGADAPPAAAPQELLSGDPQAQQRGQRQGVASLTAAADRARRFHIGQGVARLYGALGARVGCVLELSSREPRGSTFDAVLFESDGFTRVPACRANAGVALEPAAEAAQGSHPTSDANGAAVAAAGQGVPAEAAAAATQEEAVASAEAAPSLDAPPSQRPACSASCGGALVAAATPRTAHHGISAAAAAAPLPPARAPSALQPPQQWQRMASDIWVKQLGETNMTVHNLHVNRSCVASLFGEAAAAAMGAQEKGSMDVVLQVAPQGPEAGGGAAAAERRFRVNLRWYRVAKHRRPAWTRTDATATTTATKSYLGRGCAELFAALGARVNTWLQLWPAAAADAGDGADGCEGDLPTRMAMVRLLQEDGVTPVELTHMEEAPPQAPGPQQLPCHAHAALPQPAQQDAAGSVRGLLGVSVGAEGPMAASAGRQRQPQQEGRVRMLPQQPGHSSGRRVVPEAHTTGQLQGGQQSHQGQGQPAEELPACAIRELHGWLPPGVGLPPLRLGEWRCCGLTFHPDVAPVAEAATAAWAAGHGGDLSVVDATLEQVQLPPAVLAGPLFRSRTLSGPALCARLASVLKLHGNLDRDDDGAGADLPQAVPADPRVAVPCDDAARGGLGLAAAAALRAGTVVCAAGGYVLPAGTPLERLAGLPGFRAAGYRAARPGRGAAHWQLLVRSYLLPCPWWHSPADADAAGAVGLPSLYGSPLVISQLGYGNEAALVNDPRVTPWAWHDGHDVDRTPEELAAAGGPTSNCVVLPFVVRGLALPFLVTCRDVAPGEQLLRDYGASWWHDDRLTHFLQVLEDEGTSMEELVYPPGEVDAAKAEPATTTGAHLGPMQ